MSTSRSTLEHLTDCLTLVPVVTWKPMMGEYCVYSQGRIFGLVCDGTLFPKTTPETIELFEDRETKAYPGSKNTAPANHDGLKHPEELREIARVTLEHTPITKAKKTKC